MSPTPGVRDGSRLSRVAPLVHLGFGALFGAVLACNGAADYDAMQRMFFFEDVHLYGLAAATTALTAAGFFFARRSASRAAFARPRPVRRGTILGAMIFGVGWGVSGTCPGTALVQIGSGHWIALATLAGVVLGQVVFAFVNERVWRLDPTSC